MNTPLQEVQNIFTAVDRDKSGAIDATELQSALVTGGYQISLQVAAMLIRLHDANGDARIDMNEFINLHKFLGDTQAAFVAAAGSATPQCNTIQLRNLLNTLGRKSTTIARSAKL